VLTYRATIPLSTRTLTRLTELLRARRRDVGGRWRRLEPDQQALLVLAHLRNGDTRDRLAGGFDISATTVWRYIREAVDLLTAAAPTPTRRRGASAAPGRPSTGRLAMGAGLERGRPGFARQRRRPHPAPDPLTRLRPGTSA
jgi:hypothetical protein